MNITENQYHHFGLLAEILSVGSFQIGHMAQINQALQFLLASRNEYEANQPKAEENTEASTDGIDAREKNSGHVRKPKKRKPR